MGLAQRVLKMWACLFEIVKYPQKVAEPETCLLIRLFPQWAIELKSLYNFSRNRQVVWCSKHWKRSFQRLKFCPSIGNQDDHQQTIALLSPANGVLIKFPESLPRLSLMTFVKVSHSARTLSSKQKIQFLAYLYPPTRKCYGFDLLHGR